MEPLKNHISQALIELTAHHISQHMPDFDAPHFLSMTVDALPMLELKARVTLIADALHALLPKDSAARFCILAAVLHPDDHTKAQAQSDTDGLCGWGVWPLTELVGTYGLDDFEAALALLKEMTKRGTAEFAVRPFIIADQARAFAIFNSWRDDPNHHVRRLLSEGTRPRLPWGVRLQNLVQDPDPGLRLIEHLKDDPSEYVRRSVANHLNDVAKDHPNTVSALAQSWLKDASPDRERLLRHACRTLIKQGHAPTLSAFGYGTPKIIEPELHISPEKVAFGASLQMHLGLRSDHSAAQPLIIDYVIHFRKSNGSLSPKVFKWTKIDLAPGESRDLSKAHPFIPITVRRYYPGPHKVTIRINGIDFGSKPFDLLI